MEAKEDVIVNNEEKNPVITSVLIFQKVFDNNEHVCIVVDDVRDAITRSVLAFE